MIWPDGMIYDADVIGPWVVKRGGGDYVPGTAQAIGRIRNGSLVGGILYQEFNGANIICHIAAEGHYWLNRIFLFQIFDYPFRQLGVKRITAPVASVNRKARRFVERLGFVQEAVLKDAHPEGDIIIYCMRREDCRWLELRHG